MSLKPARTALLLCLAAALASVLLVAPALAAFPGGNGKIVYDSNDDGDYDVYTVGADGISNLTASSPASDRHPAYSPDGRRIVFQSDRDGNEEIYAMNVDGSGLARLTSDAADDTEPTFSPDGKRIAFVSERDGNPEIYAMNADGSGQGRLTQSASPDLDPAFNPVALSAGSTTPAGALIFFVGEREGSMDLFVMNADGTSPRPVGAAPFPTQATSGTPPSRRTATQSPTAATSPAAIGRSSRSNF